MNQEVCGNKLFSKELGKVNGRKMKKWQQDKRQNWEACNGIGLWIKRLKSIFGI